MYYFENKELSINQSTCSLSLIAFFSAARAAFCTSRGPFCHYVAEFATSPSRCAEKNAPIKLSTIPWILPDVTTLFFSMINVNDMISLKQENNLIAVSVSFFLPMIYIKGGKLATALR